MTQLKMNNVSLKLNYREVFNLINTSEQAKMVGIVMRMENVIWSGWPRDTRRLAGYKFQGLNS